MCPVACRFRSGLLGAVGIKVKADRSGITEGIAAHERLRGIAADLLAARVLDP